MRPAAAAELRDSRVPPEDRHRGLEGRLDRPDGARVGERIPRALGREEPTAAGSTSRAVEATGGPWVTGTSNGT